MSAIKKCKDANFLVLLRRERSLVFKAVYTLDPSTKIASLVWGDGPATVEENMIEGYFKYDSAGKQFNVLRTASLAPTTDAICLHSKYHRKKRSSRK